MDTNLNLKNNESLEMAYVRVFRPLASDAGESGDLSQPYPGRYVPSLTTDRTLLVLDADKNGS